MLKSISNIILYIEVDQGIVQWIKRVQSGNSLVMQTQKYAHKNYRSQPIQFLYILSSNWSPGLHEDGSFVEGVSGINLQVVK